MILLDRDLKYKLKFILTSIQAPCFNNPCQNGGTCSNYDNTTRPYYSCACPFGYTGANCEIGKLIQKYLHVLIDKNILFNLFVLFLNIFTFKILIAPCASSPCRNGATCSNNNNDTSPFFSCNCINGYSGQTCSIGKNFETPFCHFPFQC